MTQLLDRVGPVTRDPARTASVMLAGGGSFVVLPDGRILSDTHGTLFSVMAELLESPHLVEPVRSAVEKVRDALDAAPTADMQKQYQIIRAKALETGFVFGRAQIDAETAAVRIDYDKGRVRPASLTALDHLVVEMGVTRPAGVSVRIGDAAPLPLRSCVRAIRADRLEAEAGMSPEAGSQPVAQQRHAIPPNHGPAAN